jgi:hypothetical protein
MDRTEVLKILAAKNAAVNALTTELSDLYDQIEADDDEVLDPDELAILDQAISHLHQVIEDPFDWTEPLPHNPATCANGHDFRAIGCYLRERATGDFDYTIETRNGKLVAIRDTQDDAGNDETDEQVRCAECHAPINVDYDWDDSADDDEEDA